MNQYFMDSLEEKEPSIQIQVRSQEIHQIPTTMKEEKSAFESFERDDDHHQQAQKQQQQQQKRSIDSKFEEQRESMDTHQRVNGEEEEQEKAEKTSDHKMEILKGHENGGVLGPRERLKRHRREVAGHVWIPDMWGQEDFLTDWIDCTAFDASLVPQNIMLARASLMEEGRRSNSNTLRVENSF